MRVLILSSLCFFASIKASGQEYVTVSVFEHRIECQACYNTYSVESWEFDPGADSGEQYACFGTICDYQLMLKQVQRYLFTNEERKSDCSESNSGKHLWKKISINMTSSENMVYHPDHNYCNQLETYKQDSSWEDFLLTRALFVGLFP